MIKKIQEAFQKRKWEKVRKEYLQLIEKNPKDTRSRLRLGDIYSKADMKREAAEQYAASAEIFSEAGFHLKSIALYKQILKLEPRSKEALRRAAQISYQYGLYADACPYYEALARILHEQEGEQELWEIYQEITQVPIKETRRRIQVFEEIFPEKGGTFSDPFDRLCRTTETMSQEETAIDDAVAMAIWLSGYYPDKQQGYELLLSLLYKAGYVGELEKILQRLMSLYEADGQLEEKQDFLRKFQEAADSSASTATIEEAHHETAGTDSGQVKIKMEANIYDLLKKKSSEQQQMTDGSEGGESKGGVVESPLEKLEFDDLFKNFKQGIQGQIADEDSETHYNLGIAYQEMELFQDAIEEFKLACGNPALQYDALFMMGSCSRELSNPDDAFSYYEKALSVTGLSEDQTRAIRYEQALLLRAAGKKQEALEIFQDIGKTASDYRDVQQQIEELL